jgi:hypothetical protein
MKFDFVSFLGGLTAGAAGAALLELTQNKKLLGQGVVAGGPGGGGFGGGSYAPGGFGQGVVVGPGSSAVSSSIGPSVVGMGPLQEGEVTGPIVAVPPTIHDGTGAFGDSFFGVNVSSWFWPLNVFPIYQPLAPPPPQTVICKKVKSDKDEETFVCQRRYPVQTVAWGPPAGWL